LAIQAEGVKLTGFAVANQQWVTSIFEAIASEGAIGRRLLLSVP